MSNTWDIFETVQDSAIARASDSTSATAVPTAEPQFRTPQNVGYLQIAYTVAAVIYGSYLLLLRRRWSALKKRQANNAAHARR